MMRIAVVEDNADNRLLLQAILGERYRLVEYLTGTSALCGLRSDPPDLVLMDISLPEMDGTEVLRQMRQEPALRQLPVIALTAHAMSGDRDKYLAAGFDEYVSKPLIDHEQLLEPIERLLAAQSGRGQG